MLNARRKTGLLTASVSAPGVALFVLGSMINRVGYLFHLLLGDMSPGLAGL